MTMPGFAPEPLRVACATCGAEGWTFDYQHPDLAVECACCPVAHDHAGLGCRPVAIYGTAYLRVVDLDELMDKGNEQGTLPASEISEGTRG